jgi:7-cyano-7-deazaguanine synthase in queuosine biosynthesis
MLRYPIKKILSNSFSTLVMFSGGIDSTAALFYVLSHSEIYGNNIHVHHINIQNEENRWEVELMAVNATYEYLREHLKFSFTTSESTFNTPSFNGNFLYDVEIIGFMSGYMTSRDPSIKKVIIGATGTDWRKETEHSKKTIERSKSMHNAFHRDVEDHSGLVKEFPMKDMTKQEVYDSLPPELAELTWSCRRPQFIDGKFAECGRCRTCLGELREIKRRPRQARK